jgi:Transposase IS116/IS110/IS902 family
VEAIRTLMVARRSAAGERTRTINQARALVLTGPDDLRARFAKHKPAALITGLAALRPRPGDVAGHATRIALRELGRRAQFLDGQLVRLDELIVPLVTARAPGLLAVYGAGPRTAALLLIAAGDHPERLRSEAAWAHLCGVAPIPASSGKSPATASTPAVTARPATPCGGSCSPAGALMRPHAPTPSAAQRKEVQGGDHPLPQALRRPRGLPPAAPGRRVTPKLRGRPDPIFGCREPAGLRTIRRPSPVPSLTC